MFKNKAIQNIVLWLIVQITIAAFIVFMVLFKTKESSIYDYVLVVFFALNGFLFGFISYKFFLNFDNGAKKGTFCSTYGAICNFG